jgi:hypothetical protein
MESFWREDGARFLICTSAGAEGINLQIGRIIINYDLPWNPMAVEQRIGRVHRYGQQETVQVYNLVARDTVEEKIYSILEEKLGEIARAVGRTDESGQPVEDFRSEILGFLGGKPDYQELYKRAMVNKDYRWTEAEVKEMLVEANRAREALEHLTQDMSGFNLEHYKQLEGLYSLKEMGEWVRAALLRLGGAAMPAGDGIWMLVVPEELRRPYRLLNKYERVCFDREMCLRVKNVELGGIGHPLVDALLSHFRGPGIPGEVAGLGGTREVCARYLVRFRTERGQAQSRIVTLSATPGSGTARSLQRLDLPSSLMKESDPGKPAALAEDAKVALEDALKDRISQWFPTRSSRTGLSVSLVGLHVS